MSKENSGQGQLFDRTAWGDVARLCRRICLLRASGHTVEATRLQSAEFSRTVDAARSPDDTNAQVESRLRELFAAEEQRIDDALALAELLAPMLHERLSLAAPVVSHHAPSAPAAAAVAAPVAVKPARNAAPTIADFIDDMLDQERTDPPPARLRRAS